MAARFIRVLATPCAFVALAGQVALAALVLTAASVHAAPYVPARGDAVVEHVPRRADPQQQELRRLHARLAQAPRDLALATTLAWRYVAVARSDSDPRYLGYAQAALAPWWRLPAPPPSARLLRATVLQSMHRFPEALADLDAVVAADPLNVQAWLTRAAVQTVRGDYAGATAGCARVSALATDLAAISCIANVASMTGRAAGAFALLETTLRRNGQAEPALRAWSLTLLAEIAARRADAAAAEAHFREALKLTPRDAYLQAAYADFLLDQHRPHEVLALLRGLERVDALLLRLALAQRQLGEPDAAPTAAELGARFAAAARRGDSVHQREQARYELELRGDPPAALALARRNWEVQKEPADMRILLEAALAARDPSAAAPVLAWIRGHGIDDPLFARLAVRLQGPAMLARTGSRP